jgi:GNAT superfamily N-acetyltransferase
MELEPLDAASDGDRQAAAALLEAALPFDHARVVTAEKLFGGNGGKRIGHTVGAWSDSRELLGVLAQAGRFIKLLAVIPSARRRGIGTMLLKAAQESVEKSVEKNRAAGAPRPRLRVGDHAGNYLSPGLDVRQADGQAFLRARGFTEVGQNLNLLAPLRDNPLISEARVEALEARVRSGGYTARRATADDVEPLLAMVSEAFSPVWAHEVARALGPELGGPPAAHTPTLREGAAVHLAWDGAGAIVAFAAHDGNNRGLGWFGPTGVLPAHRGHGIGELLLLHCLRDVGADIDNRPDGGVIAWVGPVEYYARACAARPDRRFAVYEES